MNKVLLPLALFCTTQLFAQNVNIPDANFKAALINHSPKIDTNNDKEISLFEAQACTSKVNVPYKRISDLTGIEAFTNITELDCSQNPLNNLNVSQNTKLTYLNCYDTRLSSLDVSKNTLLTFLMCFYNQLTNLDVSKNTALTFLACSENQLTSLDVSTNVNLKVLAFLDNSISSISLTNNIALTELDCSSNQLTNLDLSKNTLLKTLKCSNNKLSGILVNGLSDLNEFSCSNNQFTMLDVSANSQLSIFDCSQNPSLKTICINSSQQTTNWQKDVSASYSTSCAATTSIENSELINLSIAPNPVTESFSVIGVEGIESVSILNTLGGAVKAFTSQATYSVSDLGVGIYIVEVKTSSGVSRNRIVVN